MMSSMNEEDPFLQVQADVLAQLGQTRPLFTSYLRIRSLTTTPTSPELTSALTDLESSLSTLAEDLADLIASVRAVESSPSAYNLSAAEVTRRKRLVGEVGGEVEDMREELAKSLHRAPIPQNPDPTKGARGKAPMRAGQGYSDADPLAQAEEGDAYGEFEQQEQLRIMAEQDRDLDGVFRTVGNLRQQADVMGREIEEQNLMIEDVDRIADRVGGRLQTGMKKMGEVMRRNEDRWSGCCIGVLIFVLILLLVLVLVL